MKIFVDSANLVEIEEALKRGFVSGITTNPSILAKEPKSGFEEHILKIVALLKKYGLDIPLSVEVFSKKKEEIIEQALRFREVFRYDNIAVKIQIGWDELEAIRFLKEKGVDVNCTACMDVMQAAMAAAAGARYVSLFWGRIRDGGKSTNSEYDLLRAEAVRNGLLDDSDFDPARVVGLTRNILDRSYPGVEIIVGSIRSVVDVRDAAAAGAHIVTVPPKFFPGMVSHFKTDEVIAQFLRDFEAWLS